jgi:hypothetical protein
VRLYSNLPQDLFNKEHKQKEEIKMREGLTFYKNCKITIRIFDRKKSEKDKKQSAVMFGAAPQLCPKPRWRALKRGGSQNGDTVY